MKVRSLFPGAVWGVLVLGLVLSGCTGDDGAPGPEGPQGPAGPEGPAGPVNAPYVRSNLGTDFESCVVCHGPDRVADVGVVHGDVPEVILPSVITAIDVSADPELLEGVEVVSQITDVTIASPPVVTFTLQTVVNDTPINGLENLWNDDNSFVRFTITQLLPGGANIPDSWVAYTRDATSGEPDYDTGASLANVGPGTYQFTFNTDVSGATNYDATLTHRVAGQIGDRGHPLQPQNMFYDFVPDGSSVTRTRNIAVMESCNECHDDLVFHGRRFLVEYCVQCHNPDLAVNPNLDPNLPVGAEKGEGNMTFMIHRIHNSGAFAILDNAADFGEVTYPQDVNNCRKCHSSGDIVDVTITPEGDNWKNLPNIASCDGCHEVFTPTLTHTGGDRDDGSCVVCHSADDIEAYHATSNSTPHNPNLITDFPGQTVAQRNITYDLIDANIVGGNVVIQFSIFDDGTAIDLTNLPADLTDGAGSGLRYPGFLLAWAQAQDGIATPGDFNNLGNDSAQPLSISIGDLDPISAGSTVGTLTYDKGVHTATLMGPATGFPLGATMRTVGLQGYLQQDLDGDGADDVSLHTPSKVTTVAGDTERRYVVDSDKCANCHEWFEGHGGNRVFTIEICTMCHVPNLSSGGRTIVPPPPQGILDDFADHGPIPGVDPNDPLTYPEDAQNLKDMVHGIHSSGFRTRDYQHVRGGSHGGYYNWSEVTFPRGASTSHCYLCHDDDSYELPLADNLLATTVRITSVEDGNDPDAATVSGARQTVPNATDWVNSPTASACGFCHTGEAAVAHMRQSGGFLRDSPFGE